MEGDVSKAILRRIEEAQNLLYGVAEHHPYWAIAHYLLDVLHTLFTKWNEDLSREEWEDLLWRLDKARDQVLRVSGLENVHEE